MRTYINLQYIKRSASYIYKCIRSLYLFIYLSIYSFMCVNIYMCITYIYIYICSVYRCIIYIYAWIIHVNICIYIYTIIAYSYGKSQWQDSSLSQLPVFMAISHRQGTLVLHSGVDRPVHSCLCLRSSISAEGNKKEHVSRRFKLVWCLYCNPIHYENIPYQQSINKVQVAINIS